MTQELDIDGLENAKNNLNKIQKNLSNQEKIIEQNQESLSNLLYTRNHQKQTSENIDESFSLLHDSYISAIKNLQENTKEIHAQLVEKLKTQNNLISNFLETEVKNFANKNLGQVKDDLKKQINKTTTSLKTLIEEQNDNIIRQHEIFEKQKKSMTSNSFFAYFLSLFNCFKILIFFILLNLYTISAYQGILVLSSPELANWINFTSYIIFTALEFTLGTVFFLYSWDMEWYEFSGNCIRILLNLLGFFMICSTPFIASSKLSWFVF